MSGPELDREDARQGETRNVVRYILGISVALAVVILGGIYIGAA